MIIVKESTYPFNSGDGKTHSCKTHLYMINHLSFLLFIAVLSLQSQRGSKTSQLYLCGWVQVSATSTTHEHAEKYSTSLVCCDVQPK